VQGRCSYKFSGDRGSQSGPPLRSYSCPYLFSNMQECTAGVLMQERTCWSALLVYARWSALLVRTADEQSWSACHSPNFSLHLLSCVQRHADACHGAPRADWTCIL